MKPQIGDIVKKRHHAIGIKVDKSGKHIYQYDYKYLLLMQKVLTGFLTIDLESGKMMHIFDMTTIEEVVA